MRLISKIGGVLVPRGGFPVPQGGFSVSENYPIIIDYQQGVSICWILFRMSRQIGNVLCFIKYRIFDIVKGALKYLLFQMFSWKKMKKASVTAKMLLSDGFSN